MANDVQTLSEGPHQPGAVQRMVNVVRRFFIETGDELAKCSWPSREELVQSTFMVILVAILIGTFGFLVGFGFVWGLDGLGIPLVGK